MSVIYLLPTLPPKDAQTEAIAQEVAFLQRTFGGKVIHVNPNIHLPRPLIPRLGFGWHKWLELRRLAHDADLFHFFNPDPFPYPFLLTLPKPVVYTITAGLDTGGLGASPLNRAYFRRMAMVTVPDERTLAQLQQAGLHNVAWQRPIIDTARFTHTPLPLMSGGPLRLLVASAPWTLAQFATKGFDALFAAVKAMPDLHVTLLWRGLLVEEARARIAALGIGEQVTLIDETVDVNAVLADIHAAAIFATAPGIIKSYPHSLLDALAAGRPVLLNSVIPMSDYVKKKWCGVVIDAVTPEAIMNALAALRAHYTKYVAGAVTASRRDFTETQARTALAAIYATVRNKATPP